MIRGARKVAYRPRALGASLTLASFLLVSGCGFLEDLPDPKDIPVNVDEKGFPIPSTVTAEDQKLVEELRALRAELQKRSGRLATDLAAAKRELARRQAAGEISTERVNQSPADIRDAQLEELERLKAELARRRVAADRKQEIISTALTENETAYASIDRCLSSGPDFRNAFDGQAGLQKIVNENDAQVYRNIDKTLLVLTSKDTCDVSFSAASLDDYTVGLQHVLETQGGVVESRSVAGLTVLSVAHPRGNFRLANGRKVIGQGGGTNLYTTISIVDG
ncbi:MAG: hypothetical protein AAGE61_01565 [Pseudomonadota bacterium]